MGEPHKSRSGEYGDEPAWMIDQRAEGLPVQFHGSRPTLPPLGMHVEMRVAVEKPLVDVMAKLLREVRQLSVSEHWKAPPPWWREIDAALERWRWEGADAVQDADTRQA